MWIQTYSGRKFDLLEPRPEDVCIDDIAHALSNLCRFTGHTPLHYSVAQHSVLVSRMIDPEFAFVGLMHDAAEAYVGDVAAPLKKAMRGLMREIISGRDEDRLGWLGGNVWSPYDEMEMRTWRAIAKRFDLPEILPPEVKEADLRMLATEKKMFGREPQSWNLDVEFYDIFIKPWSAKEAYLRFMERFVELT